MIKTILTRFILIFSIFIFLPQLSFSQKTTEEKLSRKEEKKLKKLQQEQERQFKVQKANELIEKKHWVLALNTLRSDRGSILNANMQTNYIYVNGDDMVIQFSERINWDSQQYSIPSFINASRRECVIRQYNITASKKKNEGHSVQTMLQGCTSGAKAMLIYVKPEGGQITMRVGKERIFLSGEFMDPEESNILNLTPNTMFKKSN